MPRIRCISPLPAFQPPAARDAALTQNVYETILETTKNVLLHRVTVRQDVANETVNFRFTKDGVVEETTGVSLTAGTEYQVCFSEVPDDGKCCKVTTINETYMKGSLFAARSLKIEIRKTTAAGANATASKVIYSKW